MNKWFPVSGVFLVLVGGIILFSGLSHKDLQAKFCVKAPQDLVGLFPKSLDEIKACEKEALSIIDKVLADILSVPADERTFANTVLVYDRLDFNIAPIYGGLEALKYLSPDKDLRENAQMVMVRLHNYLNEKLGLNKDVYLAFEAYEKGGAKKESLSADQAYFLKETMAGFRRSGLNLPDSELEKVRKVTEELVSLGQQFDTNIASDDRKVVVSGADLVGVGDEFIAALEQDKDGNYVLGCDYPTYFRVMDHCEVADTRQKLCRAFSNRAYPQNYGVLKQIIAKRDELAKLLGFASYADLDLDSQMVKKPERAREFLLDVMASAKVKAEAEVAEFTKDLPASVDLVDGKIRPWDSRFIKTQYKKKKLALDELLISEYFPLENTISKLLWVYEQFMGLEFRQIDVKGLWSDEVRTVEVHDVQNNELIGYLLLDLFPRPNKFTHAAMFQVVPAVQLADDISDCPAVAVVMANFPRSSGDKEALLMYNDVNTFFHEFGHALHGLLGKTNLASFSGTSVKRDFVEMPSQMLEDWLKDAGVLAKITSHYQTGEPLSKDLIDKIVQLEQFDAGDSTLRQLKFGLLALDCFDSGADKDPQALYKDNHMKVSPYIMYDDEGHTTASFGHLNGYGAKYYGYMWSKVFAKDLFAHINKQGLLNPKIGREYVAKVIGQGGQKDPNELLKDFLGREPNKDAFMSDLGFK